MSMYTCPTCDGSGWIDDEEFGITVACPVCNPNASRPREGDPGFDAEVAAAEAALARDEAEERAREAAIEEAEERSFWMDGDDDHRRFGRAVYGY